MSTKVHSATGLLDAESLPSSGFQKAIAAGPWLRRTLIYSVLYVVAGTLGFVPSQPAVFHTIWLPGGIALSALIFCGYRCLPMLVAAHVATRIIGGFAWDVIWPSTFVNVAQAALSFRLLQRVRFNPALRTVRDVLLLLACGAVLPCLVGCVVRFLCFRLMNQPAGQPFGTFCTIYVLRGTAGVIATVPILLAFSPGRREAWLPARKFELGMTAALTALAAVTIFFSPTNLGYWSYARSFLPYPFLVWAALRLGLPGLAICTLIVTSCAVQGTAAGRGPFVADHDLNSVLIVWTYLCISTVTSLLLCVSREERRELEAMLIEAGELERIRLGTELHDDICQQLAGAGFIGSSLRNRPEWIAPEARIQLDHVCTEIQRSIQSMRNLARGLSPLGIGTQHLSVALADLAALSEAIYGIECRFNAAKPLPALNRDATTHLFRITQEAVSNSVRHGHAARVEIIAETSDHGLNLSVADNGHGLPDTLDDKGGLGFKTMAYRADLMNGSFSVRNRSDQCGVVVTCSIPVLSN